MVRCCGARLLLDRSALWLLSLRFRNTRGKSGLNREAKLGSTFAPPLQSAYVLCTFNRSNFNQAGEQQVEDHLMTPASAAAAAFERQDALVVSASFLRAAFGGASAVYSLRLGQPCTSVVVVHLLLPSDAVGSVRLSSDRLRFTPDNFGQPQLVRVEALENHTQWSVISHRLFSLDRSYDRALAPSVVVHMEATPLECPLLTFGGLTTKRKAAAMGSTHSRRLDISVALPEETGSDAAEQDASWCVSHLASGCHFSVAAVAQPRGTTLLAWGLNSNGELGNGTMTSSPTPQMVVTFPCTSKGSRSASRTFRAGSTTLQ